MPRAPGISRRRATLPVILAIVFFCPGCGGPANRVTGTVTFEQKPLPAGRVTFLCDGQGRPVIDSRITDGRYRIDNPPVGRASVIVETFKPEPRPPEGVNPTTGIDYSVGWEDTGPYVPIPKRYALPKTSGLECTIVPGGQAFDIVLTK